MKSFLAALLLLHLFLFADDTSAQNHYTKYMPTDDGYLMVLTEGDDIFKLLKDLAEKENIPSANFTGMGFVDVEFGYYNFSKKKFRSKKISRVELASMTGSIAWQNGEVSIHAHGVVAGRNFNAKAGHILSAKVGTGSAEILIKVHQKKLERIKDEGLGANVLQLK